MLTEQGEDMTQGVAWSLAIGMSGLQEKGEGGGDRQDNRANCEQIKPPFFVSDSAMDWGK